MTSSSIVPWQYFKELFHFDHKNIENEVRERPGHYKDLHPEALYTSYEDLVSILKGPWVTGTWIDLGAGVGLSSLMYACLYPDRKSIAIESDTARIDAGIKKRDTLGLLNCEFIHDDLETCMLPDGETYFLYFPTGMVLDRILCELRHLEKFKRLIAIESHGDLLSRLEKENWLHPVGTIPLKAPRHHPEAVVYERVIAPAEYGPHQISFLNKLLCIEDKDYSQWIGESRGLEWLSGDQYQLVYPPRTIRWSQVQKIINEEDLDERSYFLVKLRRHSPLVIQTHDRKLDGSIRKIVVSPSFKVELSSGELIEWEDIKSIKWRDILCFDSSSGYCCLPPAPWEK